MAAAMATGLTPPHGATQCPQPAEFTNAAFTQLLDYQYKQTRNRQSAHSGLTEEIVTHNENVRTEI